MYVSLGCSGGALEVSTRVVLAGDTNVSFRYLVDKVQVSVRPFSKKYRERIGREQDSGFSIERGFSEIDSSVSRRHFRELASACSSNGAGEKTGKVTLHFRRSFVQLITEYGGASTLLPGGRSALLFPGNRESRS